MQNYFLQPVFIIFTRGAINSEHDCIFKIVFIYFLSDKCYLGEHTSFENFFFKINIKLLNGIIYNYSWKNATSISEICKHCQF